MNYIRNSKDPYISLDHFLIEIWQEVGRWSKHELGKASEWIGISSWARHDQKMYEKG